MFIANPGGSRVRRKAHGAPFRYLAPQVVHMQAHLHARMHVQVHGRCFAEGERPGSSDEAAGQSSIDGLEGEMYQAYNGISAASLREASWLKSHASNPSGNCVELAELPCGEIAIRNSRFPDGPALLYTRAEIDAFIKGAKDGDFDHMLA
jgi:hypothetical protein